MKKQRIRFGLSGLAVMCLVPVWACFSSSSDSGDSGAPTNTGTGMAPPSNGDDGSVSAVPTPDASTTGTVTVAQVIDDMSDPTNTATATGGYWYTYDDRTVPNSEPPTFPNPAPPGMITPVEGTTFSATASSAATPGPTGSDGTALNFRECSGGGETTWGAGFGFDFTDFNPDGGAVALNSCEAGTIFNTAADNDAGNTGIPQPFDASAFSGVTFWGRSVSGSQVVNVQLSNKQTSPWGGVCNVCLNGGVGACADDYIKAEQFTTTWTQFTIKWTDTGLKTANWSKSNLKTPIDASSLYYMHWQLSTTAKVALKNFDVQVANVGFIQ